jgi:hypothetical protein
VVTWIFNKVFNIHLCSNKIHIFIAFLEVQTFGVTFQNVMRVVFRLLALSNNESFEKKLLGVYIPRVK